MKLYLYMYILICSSTGSSALLVRGSDGDIVAATSLASCSWSNETKMKSSFKIVGQHFKLFLTLPWRVCFRSPVGHLTFQSGFLRAWHRRSLMMAYVVNCSMLVSSSHFDTKCIFVFTASKKLMPLFLQHCSNVGICISSSNWDGEIVCYNCLLWSKANPKQCFIPVLNWHHMWEE